MHPRIKQLLGAAKGNLVSIGELADSAAGGHLGEFFKTSDERLDETLTEDVRDGVLELAKLVEYNGTAIRIVLEILELVIADEQANEALDRSWRTSREPRPDLRDLIVGASQIAPAYASSTAPLRRLYVTALRGSYAPEIYTFGFGPELLNSLIDARLLPFDLSVLEDLAERGTRKLELSTQEAKLESYERLATGDFAELLQREGPRFFRHRTEAVVTAVSVRITPKGRRLLKMITAGRGESSSG